MSFYYNDVLIPKNHGALGGFALLKPIPGICPVSNGDLRWLLDPHPMLCILVIITVTMPLSFLNSNFMNYGHTFCMSAPLVMDKMRLLFKRANKIHVRGIAFYYKFSSANYRHLQPLDYTPIPPTNVSPGPTKGIQIQLCSSLKHF